MFGESAPNQEYDILLPLTTDSILHIEATDYSGTDDEPGFDDVVNEPRNAASLLGNDMTISIVGGASETFDQHKGKAKLRDDVRLCSREEYIETVRLYIQDEMIPGSLNRVPGR